MPLKQLEPTRRDTEQRIVAEIDAWRTRALPDATAPLDADDLVRLLRECVEALSLDSEIASGFTVNTVHYYRRKDIIDPPSGRTISARYGVRHLWQIAGARIAGHLGLVTLAEARDTIRSARDSTLLSFLAARVTDARARTTMRAGNAVVPSDARPLPDRTTQVSASASPPVMISLPGDAWCIVPASHEAHRSHDAAGDLARALAVALRALHKP